MKSIVLACVIYAWLFSAAGQVGDFSAIRFARADSIAFLYPKHSLQDLRKLSNNLTVSLTSDVEKFRALYRWVCENIEYDYVLFKKNQRQREKLTNPTAVDQWNRKMNSMAFHSLLHKHKTVCTGYAYLLRELARYANIPCEIVDGYGRTAVSNVGGHGVPNHQWTRVQLNGKWYLADATWSSGSMIVPAGSYAKEFNDSYFLMDPQLFIRNHYQLDTTWTLLQSQPTLRQFLTRPLVYNKCMTIKTTQLWPETFEISVNKKEPVQIKFNAERLTLENVAVSVNGQVTAAYASLSPDIQGQYSIIHQFSGRGIYVMNVSQNNQYLFSYKVKVQK